MTTPDVADLRLGVAVTKPTVKEARNLAADQMTTVIAALRKLGIADKDMQTTGLSIQPNYTYPFMEIENVMAEHLGHETKERRLLAVMREPMRPRLGLRTRLYLDMTDDDEFAITLQRLVHELSLPSSRPWREAVTEVVS